MNMPDEKEKISTTPETKTTEIQNSESTEFNVEYAVLGDFFVLGIPAIIISLIIWKIRKRKSVS